MYARIDLLTTAICLAILLASSSVAGLPQVAPAQPYFDDKAIEALMNKWVRETPVRLLSKSYCPLSRQVKQILDGYQLRPNAYKATELDLLGDNELMNAIQDYLQRVNGIRSVPQLYVGGQFLGGASEAVAMDQSGELRQRLAQAGALA